MEWAHSSTGRAADLSVEVRAPVSKGIGKYRVNSGKPCKMATLSQAV